ncbi:MAG: hypothetical protein ACYC7L_15955 [Nitrospirota bacterium]
MRRSTKFFWTIGTLVLLLAAAWSHAGYAISAKREMLAMTAELAARLELTDLCLFTEARYTRHPSQADLHSPFQDHPMSLEHFPSGSLISPRRPGGGR